MTVQHRRIVRVLVRYQLAVAAAEARWAEAADRDAAFDGGEFSGPASWRAFDREREAFARRFGFTSAAVADQAVDALECNIAWKGAIYTGR